MPPWSRSEVQVAVLTRGRSCVMAPVRVRGVQWDCIQSFFFKKNMAVVAPPGAVATALRHVRYQKQARSASDTRPHRAVPVTDAHRARSLTCILTAGIDAGAGTLKWRLLYTYDALPPRVAGDLRGIHNRTRLRRRIDAGGPLAGPPRAPALRGA